MESRGAPRKRPSCRGIFTRRARDAPVTSGRRSSDAAPATIPPMRRNVTGAPEGGCMAHGRPAATIVLTDTERTTLELWTRQATRALRLRCRIVLGAARCLTNQAVAASLGCHPATVAKWRRRFAERRLEGLRDERRTGRPRTITEADVERVLRTASTPPPANARRWTSYSLARATGLSQTSVSRIRRSSIRSELTT